MQQKVDENYHAMWKYTTINHSGSSPSLQMAKDIDIFSVYIQFWLLLSDWYISCVLESCTDQYVNNGEVLVKVRK